MRKLLTLLMAIVLAFSFTLVGCGGGNSGNKGDDSDTTDSSSGNSGKTTITFAGRGQADEEANYAKFISDFNKANPDILVVPTWSPDETSYKNYLDGLSGASMPHVFMMDDRDFLLYASAGALLDIKSYVTQEELDSMYETAYSKYYYNRSTKTLGDKSGGLYGLPKDQGPYTLVYNETLIKEIMGEDAELPSATEPMTFVTFVEYCKNILNTAKEKDSVKYANLYGIGAYELEAAVYSNNADFFDEGAKNSRITEKNFIDAVQWIADLYLEHGIMPDSGSQANNNAYQRFTSGQALFCFAGPWDCTKFWKELRFKWDLCPAVVGTAEGAVSTAWVGSMAYSVSGAIKNKKEREAAIKFAKYLSMSLDSQRTQYSIGQAIPNLKSLENEYCNDTEGLIGNQNGPAHRSVWIDTINGTSETDRVTGKSRACYYTYGSDWLTGLTETFSTQGLWTTKNKAESIIKNYNKYFQAYLDDYQDQI